jgi:hypothetical protein
MRRVGKGWPVCRQMANRCCLKASFSCRRWLLAAAKVHYKVWHSLLLSEGYSTSTGCRMVNLGSMETILISHNLMATQVHTAKQGGTPPDILNPFSCIECNLQRRVRGTPYFQEGIGESTTFTWRVRKHNTGQNIFFLTLKINQPCWAISQTCLTLDCTRMPNGRHWSSINGQNHGSPLRLAQCFCSSCSWFSFSSDSIFLRCLDREALSRLRCILACRFRSSSPP